MNSSTPNRPTFNRRALLASLSGLAVSALAGPARAAPFFALDFYEQGSGGRIGVFAENIVTGAKIAWRADERFAMCSTFKASLAALALARVDRSEDRLDAIVAFGEADMQPYAPVARENLATGAMPVGAMARAAVEFSDNTCANLLLARAGGPEALNAFWRQTGDDLSRLDHNEPMLNRSPPGDPHDTTTPAAMAGNLRRFVVGDVLSDASRRMLIEWMVACRTGAKRLRAGLPKDWRIGDKTGNNGADAMGDIAVAWPKPDRPIIVCAYTQGGKPDAGQLLAVFTEIGKQAAGLSA